jgi:hypothetical protein
MVPAWLLGDLSAATARDFIAYISETPEESCSTASDGHRIYADGVEQTFGAEHEDG